MANLEVEVYGSMGTQQYEVSWRAFIRRLVKIGLFLFTFVTIWTAAGYGMAWIDRWLAPASPWPPSMDYVVKNGFYGIILVAVAAFLVMIVWDPNPSR
jgi:hypothetical protein